MKKLLSLLFLSTILFACGSDDDDNNGGDNNGGGGKGTTTQLGKTTNPIPESEWKGYANDPESPNYIGEGKTYVSPIWGDWVLTHENGTATNRFVAYQFVYGQGWYSMLTKPAEGAKPNFSNLIVYQYNDTQLRDEKNNILYNYKVSADLNTMTLFDGSNTWAFKKYDNNGVWKWKGDWNSETESPYYALYNGKYNPVKGVWKLVVSGGFTVDYDQYCRFDDNFSLYKSYELNTNYRFHTKYQINDDGIWGTDDSLIKNYSTNKYWIEGNTLYLQGVQSYPFKLMEISKLVRVQ